MSYPLSIIGCMSVASAHFPEDPFDRGLPETSIDTVMPDDQVLDGLSHAFHMRNRWDLVLMKMILEVDRRELYKQEAEEATEPWLSRFLGIGYWQACVLTKVARMLGDCPEITRSYAEGRLSYDHLRAVVQLEGPYDEPVILSAIENKTVADAFRNVRQMAIIDTRTSQDLYGRRWLRMKNLKDEGLLLLDAILPEDIGAAVRKAIDELASILPDDPDEDVTPLGRKRADALALMATSALGELPSRPTVVVHVDEHSLEEGEGPAETEQGPAVSVATARRLGCIGSVATMKPEDEGPGRRHRTATSSQMIALKRRDATCRFPGCHMKHHLEAHHIRPWRHDGPTSLDNLILLCPIHHRAVESGSYRIDGKIPKIRFVKKGSEAIEPGPPPAPADVPALVLQELIDLFTPRAGPDP